MRFLERPKWTPFQHDVAHLHTLSDLILFIYLFCHIYAGVPHQCAALFSLGLLHYIHGKTNINQHTFSYNTVTILTTCVIGTVIAKPASVLGLLCTPRI